MNKAEPCVVDNVLYGCDAEVGAWVNAVLGSGIITVPFVGFGIIQEATPNGPAPDSVNLNGGAYFFNFEQGDTRDCMVAVAVSDGIQSNPLQFRAQIRRILDYPFAFLDLPRITAEIRMDNEKCIRAAQTMGFVLEGRKRFKCSDGGDVGVFALYRDMAIEKGYWVPSGQQIAA